MPSSAANTAVERILRYSGLKKNFIILAADIDNAQAAIQGTDRYILYNESFMQRINVAAKTDWAAISILAHEIGHHLQGHTLKATGSRPPIELEADEYSGFILQRMGASLQDARAALSVLSSDKGSATHPGKQDRLKAITDGWTDAQQLSTPNNRDIVTNTQPVLQPAAFDTETKTAAYENDHVFYAARGVFENDASTYYITNTNLIVGFNEYNQAIIIGKKIPSTIKEYAWMYKTPFVTYGVNFKGEIIGKYPNGAKRKIGYIAAPY